MMVSRLGFVAGLVCSLGLLAQVPKTSADDLFKEASAAMQMQDFGTAEFWFKELRANYPKDTRWGLGLFTAVYGAGRFEDALKIAREIQPQYEKSAMHYVRVGAVLTRLDRPQEALGQLQIGLRYAGSPPESASVYTAMGEAYQALDQIDDAIAAHRKAKELTGRASFPLAYLLGMKGDYEGEVREYRAVVRENPDVPAALNNLAYAFAVRGENLDEALTLSRRAVQLEPRIAVMEDTLGWVYFKLGMFADAEETMIGALLYEGGNQGTLREHLAAVMDARAMWTEDRRALRGLLEGEGKAGDVAKMKALLGKVRGK
jgi:tetratricopeptide (TPR) repeat protein